MAERLRDVPQIRPRERVDPFRRTAPDKPVYLKAQLSYGVDESAALEWAYDQWRTNGIPGPATQELRWPASYDALAEAVVREHVRVSADLERHVEWLERDRGLDVEAVILHDVNEIQPTFIEDFGEHVLPALA